MLLSNYSVLNRNTYLQTGNQFTNPLALFRPCQFMNWYCGDHVLTGQTDKSAFNNGYAIEPAGGSAWWLSPKAGGLVCNLLNGSGSLSITSLSMGRALASALTGSGTISAANLALIVQLAGSLAGSGTISTATLQAISGLSAALSGSGDISAAALSLIISIEADLSGSGTLSANLKGLLSMMADITVTGTGLSTANVGEAVWARIIDAGFSAEDVMRIIAAAVAGKVSGGPGSPVFRNLGDDQDVIEGVADSSGNRTSAVYTP